MNPLFPQLPDDLAALTDDEVSSLLEEHLGVVQAIHDRDADTIGERDDETLLAELRAGIDQVNALRAEVQRRDAATTIDSLSSEALATNSGADRQAQDETSPAQQPQPAEEQSSGEQTQPEEVEERHVQRREEEVTHTERERTADPAEVTTGGDEEGGDAQTASAESEDEMGGRVQIPERYTPARREQKPRLQEVVAAGDVRGITAGAIFESRDAFYEALIARHDALANCQNGREGVFEDVPVGTIHKRFPDGRPVVASGNSGFENQRLLLELVGGIPGSHEQAMRMAGKALTADGGLCAPLPPSYDIPTFGVTDTPVNDALPTTPATRGGIRFWPIMPWNSGANAIGDAISHITKAQSDLGGSTAQKTYQRIVCPTNDTTAYVDSFVRRLRIENLKARAWPELIDAFMRNLDVAYAAEVETDALDFIAAALPTVTAPAIGNLSVVSSWVSWLATLTAGISSRNRLDPMARYRCLMPAWVPDLLVSDNVKSQFDRFRAQAEVAALLQRARIDVTYYLDSATNAGQLFAAQGGGEIVGFPSTARLYLYPEGSFVRLEFGQMDLGVTRDSTLNTVNEYELFVEEWHGYAYLGAPEAYEIAATVCDTGQTAGTIAELGCGS